MKPLLAIALVRTLLAQAPPQLRLAVPPIPPLNTPFGGVVVLNVAIDSAGTVRNISTVAGTSPFLKPSVDSGMATCRRSEEHTSELQSRLHLVCRLLLEKKKIKINKRNCNHIRITPD